MKPEKKTLMYCMITMFGTLYVSLRRATLTPDPSDIFTRDCGCF